MARAGRDITWRSFARHIWWATGAFLFLEVSRLLATHFRPRGQLYNFEPSGIGVLYSYLSTVIGWTVFYLVIANGVSVLGRAIGCILRAFFFGLVVLVGGFMEAKQAVVVVRTNGAFVFVYPWPLGHLTVPDAELYEPCVEETDFSRSVSLRGGFDDKIAILSVWRGDARGNKTVDELFDVLRTARIAGLMRPRR